MVAKQGGGVWVREVWLTIGLIQLIMIKKKLF